jgi:PilZ domain
VVKDLCLVSRLYGFSLLHLDSHTHVLLLSTFPTTIQALVNLNEWCPLGMRVADILVHHRMSSMNENFAMEEAVPMLSEQDRHEQRKNLRRYVRKMVTLRMIATDKAGLANGQVIDITVRGGGLRLTKPLTRGQYLTLKVYLNDGTGSVLCELVRVQWVKEDRAGVAFLRMSLENEVRLRRLCGDQLASELWD